MPVTAESSAPYAPATAVMSLVERHRNKGLPSPVDGEVLARASVPDSLIPRTLQALRTLDLLDSEGRPSPVFEGIRLAPEAEYQQRLQEWLQGAYADALRFVNPATDDETAIRDAFRSYNPVGMQPRMVSLFTGLFRAAGVSPEKPAPVKRTLKLVSSKSKSGATAAAAKAPLSPPPPPPPPTHKPGDEGGLSDKALEYKLVDLMKDDDIQDEERTAIWTLVQYLTRRAKKASA